MVVIIDYGMGNLGSIVKILRRVGAETTVTSSPDEIAR
jgi:imidazoleglycerol phosphate synthase glutamine amidotransferase subunit HisH